MLAVLTASLLVAADPDIPATRDRQAQVRDDTEQLARRVGTMLRVMRHYKLDAAAEKKLLDEAAATLGGLSRGQMADVVARLDAAMEAADAQTARAQVNAAYAGHRDALRKLKTLLAQYDAVRDLDAAADRLDKLARDEVELCFRVADIHRDSLDSTATDPVRRRRALKGDFPTTRARHEAEEAIDLRRDFDTLTRQLSELKPGLPADARDRLVRAERLSRDTDLAGRLDELAVQIRPEGAAANRHRDWLAAVDSAWAAAGQLQDVALALRPGRDRLQTLRESRQKVATLIDQLTTEARAGVDHYAHDAAADDAPEVTARRFADDAGRLGHATRAVQLAVTPHAAEAAESLARAVRYLWAAGAAHRQTAPFFARLYQAWAESQLRHALGAIDAATDRAEAERTDPLTATKAALETVERIIKEQSQIHEETRDLARHADEDAARKQAPQQGELAKQGGELAQAPLPTTARTKEVLNEAAQAMNAAAENLADRRPQPAADNQAEALARLNEAKAELAKEAKAIEQRREDMKALEEAGKRLDELARDQQKLASDAKAAANTEPLAAEQQKLKAPTEAVAKGLDRAAPDAARRAGQAAENMESAEKDLAQNKSESGSEKAEQAAKDLQKARDLAAKALDAKRAQEATDQAKMQPDKIDPAQAAREVAKAMEAAMEAAKSAEQASQSPVVGDLAERQGKVADQAREAGQPKAADSAQSAAKNLKQGDLDDAVPQQQKALDQLNNGGSKELAGEQQSILETTKSLAQSQSANDMAQSAVQQAKAQAPQAVQPQLDQAGRQLADAGQQLQQANPSKAGEAQSQASKALQQALRALQQSADELSKNTPPGGPPNPQPTPDANPATNPKPQERNDKVASGDRPANGIGQASKARLARVESDGSFVHLPPRQRELIRQSLTERLPPEYASMIQQYFVNIAKGKPAAKPAGEPPRGK